MHRHVFYELAECIERIETRQEGDAFLGQLLAKYGLKNVAYLGVNIPGKAEGADVFVTTTYSAEWHARYMSQSFAKIDPVVRRGLMRTAPLNWRDVDHEHPSCKQFFGEAREHGVGKQGITIPMRGALGETALFSINTDHSDAEWHKYRLAHIRDFQVLGFAFHEHILRREGVVRLPVELSERQQVVLQWAAAGKTEWETGKICGLSPRTVKYHLMGATAKLHAANKVQAVATAVRLRIV